MTNEIFSSLNARTNAKLLHTQVNMEKKSSSFWLLIALVILLALVFGWLKFPKNDSRMENASVLLEQLRTVAKLTTVEGQFSEIYNYSEYQGDFGFFWDKKALVRVRATVSAGYDLNAVNIRIDSVRHIVQIGPLPEPQILSIDHNIDYYDLSEGLFESFSTEDYNRINARAKEQIREKAQQSPLLPAAKEQALKILEVLGMMVKNAGWEVEVLEQKGALELK